MNDDIYDRALAFVLRQKYITISLVQRHLAIGCDATTQIVQRLEAEGIIAPPDRAGTREVLVAIQPQHDPIGEKISNNKELSDLLLAEHEWSKAMTADEVIQYLGISGDDDANIPEKA